MTPLNYSSMGLDDLRKYVLTHREDIQAFYVYIDRSKSSGRMIAVDPNAPKWEDRLEEDIHRTSI